jgi:hypothetical protein
MFEEERVDPFPRENGILQDNNNSCPDEPLLGPLWECDEQQRVRCGGADRDRYYCAAKTFFFFKLHLSPRFYTSFVGVVLLLGPGSTRQPISSRDFDSPLSVCINAQVTCGAWDCSVASTWAVAPPLLPTRQIVQTVAYNRNLPSSQNSSW